MNELMNGLECLFTTEGEAQQASQASLKDIEPKWAALLVTRRH